MTNWNGFKGKAKRIEDVDLPRIGHEIGVGEDVIHAVLDVESRGKGFDSKGRPIILFEPHIFYRQLKRDPALQAEAVSAGLAYPKWRRNYPKDSYPRLERAIKINERAALCSASWGLGQVMGFNHALAGFDTVQDFVLAMMDDEDNHLEAMIAFIVSAGLDDELRELESAKTRAQRIAAARDFARGYNGSGYEKNRYHIRIADRFEWWRGKPDTPWKPSDAESEDRSAELDADIEDAASDIAAEAFDPEAGVVHGEGGPGAPPGDAPASVPPPTAGKPVRNTMIGGGILVGLAAVGSWIWDKLGGIF